MNEDFVKHDTGKRDYALIPTRPLGILADIFTFGAEKYSKNNWRRGCEWSRLYSAAQRHMNQFWEGEDLDTESGLPHVCHAAWSMIALCEFMLSDIGEDDRADIKEASKKSNQNFGYCMSCGTGLEYIGAKETPNIIVVRCENNKCNRYNVSYTIDKSTLLHYPNEGYVCHA